MAISPAPLVRQSGTGVAYRLDERFEPFHAMVDSAFLSPRNSVIAH
jgi:hypothetical protein